MNTANLHLFLAALRARGRIFLMILAVTVLATGVASLLLPKTYKANALVVVNSKDEQSMGGVVHHMLPSRENLGIMQTQVDILTSEKVALRVVKELRLAEDPKAIEAFEKAKNRQTDSINDWLAEQLLQKVKVETSQGSVMKVSYQANDADAAAALANA